jgi:pimeloyl-ACP methyl ester carboxylesterase
MTEESTRRSVRVRDININYHEAGTGPETAILLHGAGPGASAWGNFYQQVGPYAERYRTLLIDMPHYGKSDRPPDKRNDIPFYTDVLLEVMDVLKIDRAHLVGNSMGGVIALRVAIDAPDRAGKLVLLGPAGTLPLFTPGPTHGQQLLRGYYQPPGPSVEKMKAWMSVIVYDQSLVTDELVQERYEASIANRPTSRPSSAGMGAIWHEAGKVNHKTLIIWGKEDRVVPMDSAFVLLRLMPNSDLHVLGKTGHWAQNERPADFNAVTLTFLSTP